MKRNLQVDIILVLFVPSLPWPAIHIIGGCNYRDMNCSDYGSQHEVYVPIMSNWCLVLTQYYYAMVEQDLNLNSTTCLAYFSQVQFELNYQK